MNPDKPGLREYLSSLGSKAARGTIGWGTRVADWVDDKVDTAKDFYERKAIASGHPLVAGATTFGTGVIGDVVKGTADVLRLGNGTADAIDQFKRGDYAGGASSLAQDGGRVGGIILTAVGAKAPTEIRANRLLRDVEAERARGGLGINRTHQASVEARPETVINRAGEKFTRSGRDISNPKVPGKVSTLNDRVFRAAQQKGAKHIHANQKVANFVYKDGVSSNELANVHVPVR
jgi:hypothetical protein